MKASILSSTPATKQVEMLSYLVYEGEKLLHNPSQEMLKRSDFTGADGQILTVDNLDGYDVVVFAGLGKKKNVSELKMQNAVASVVRFATSKNLSTLAVVIPEELSPELKGSSCMVGARLGAYQFLKYKTDEKTKKFKKIEQISFVVSKGAEDFKKGLEFGIVLASGVALARDLVNDPASHTNTQTLVDTANLIASNSENISVTVLDEEQCKKLGMGSYLSVARGSIVPPKFIVLHYSPSVSAKSPKGRSTSGRKKIALVGKSIMFDSGGLSLKPSESMEDMKIDMSGGATVLGVFKILSELSSNPDFAKATAGKEIFGILPSCENMPSGHATRPGDIVTAMNGKTIEVLNTDAEGRLTLADGLVYAEKHCKADVIIDLATLTGACMVALGNDLAGLFSNDDELSQSFEKEAKETGDEFWKMPLHLPYLKKMKSDIADLKNIGGGRYGGAITAAVFLSEFVEKAKWIHIDIAGPAFRTEAPKGALGKGATGWGVLSIYQFLISNY